MMKQFEGTYVSLQNSYNWASLIHVLGLQRLDIVPRLLSEVYVTKHSPLNQSSSECWEEAGRLLCVEEKRTESAA